MQSEIEIVRNARLSRCKTFRYVLERSWGTGDSIVFVGLNPSTADAQLDDPTVRRCIRFAREWGYDRLLLVNLFAFRATDPAELLVADDPIGPSNDQVLKEVLAGADFVVAAWGSRGDLLARDLSVLAQIPEPYCLGTTATGMPRHPLYIRADQEPVPYSRECTKEAAT